MSQCATRSYSLPGMLQFDSQNTYRTKAGNPGLKAARLISGATEAGCSDGDLNTVKVFLAFDKSIPDVKNLQSMIRFGIHDGCD